jgi:hypothetical protein
MANGVVMTVDTARKVKELVRGMNDGGGESYHFANPGVRGRRVEIVKAVAPATGDPGEFNSALFTAKVIHITGDLSEIEAGDVMLRNVDGDFGEVTAGVYYLAIQCGTDPYSGLPIFAAALRYADLTHPGILSLDDQYIVGEKYFTDVAQFASGALVTDFDGPTKVEFYPESHIEFRPPDGWPVASTGKIYETWNASAILGDGNLYVQVGDGTETSTGVGSQTTAWVRVNNSPPGLVEIGSTHDSGDVDTGWPDIRLRKRDDTFFQVRYGQSTTMSGAVFTSGLLTDGSGFVAPPPADGSITTAKLADGAVTSAKIAAGAVDTTALGSGAVTSAKIASGAVDTTALGAGAVTTAKIADSAVTGDKIAGGEITADKLADETITGDKVADGAITYAKIQDVAATSIVGRSAGSSGVSAAISASSDGDVLRRSGGSLGFGSIPASSIGSGQLSNARGGTGLDTSSAANGQLLIGNGSGLTAATITAGSGVSVTNGSGSITISATGTGTVTSVGITAPAAGITVSGSPITSSGSITLALADDLAGLEAITGTGLVVRTATNTYTPRTISATSNRIAVTNGTGVSGNPQIDIDAAYVGQTSITTLGTITTGVWNGTAVGLAYVDIVGGTATDVALDDSFPLYDTSASGNRKTTADRLLALLAPTPCGRLTLTSGTPTTSSDVTGATSIYYTPCVGNSICLWDGTRWVLVSFTEYTLALGTMTASSNYDIFGYLSSGSLALEKLIWTNDTTRGTAVTLQDGRYCKSGDKTRLYLGTVRSTSTTATEDSAAKRYVYNAYNQQPRTLYAADASTASYTYNGSWRESNAGSTEGTTRFGFVCGLAHSMIEAVNLGATKCNSVNSYSLGIGLDSSSTASGVHVLGYSGGTATSADPVIACVTASWSGFPGVGYHTLRRLEQSSGATTTWYGTNSNAGNFQSGMYGIIWG